MKAINIDEVKRNFCRGEGCDEPFCMDDDFYGGMVCAELEAFLRKLERYEIIEVIPVSYITDRIRDTCGAESAYLSRLVTRYREGRYKDELGNS